MFPPNLQTRIAPTPSGFLHLGNVFSFAVTWALARQNKGKIALRIDDLDSTRTRLEFIEDIFETLDFLGFEWDEGPKNTSDFNANYSQKLRLANYENLLQKLVKKTQVYACTCSRSMFLDNINYYACPQNCREKSINLKTPNAAWRIKIPPNTIIKFNDILLGDVHIRLDEKMPDFIVRRKDGIPAYQIASLCDDILMKTNLIVRGADLLTSTAAQLFLAEILSENTFTRSAFLHHKIITDNEGNKLSKSHQSLSIKQMRLAGLNAEDLWLKIGQIGGLKNISSAEHFLQEFNMNLLRKAHI